MYKNMIQRKSIAIGAGLSLILTGLVSTPASAESQILTQPQTGSSLNGTVSATGTSNVFILATTMSPSLIAGVDEALEYRIQNPSGAKIFITSDEDGNHAGASVETSTLFDYGTGTAATMDGNGTRETDLILDPTGAGDAANENTLGISVNGATTATQITVTAFLNQVDVDGNAIDSVETTAAPITLTFYPETALTFTTSLNPIVGDAGLTATVLSSPEINGNYFDEKALKVAFTRPGSTAAIENAVTWSNVTNSWSNSGSALDLDGSVSEWVGLPNVAGLLFSSQTTADGLATFVVDRGNFLATGDVVRIVSALAPASLSTTRIAVRATSGASTFEVDRSAAPVTDNVTRAVDAGHIVVLERQLTGNVVIASDKRTATFTTLAAHGLSAGDLVNIDSSNGATLDASRAAVTAVSSSTSFKIAYPADKTVGTFGETGLVDYVSLLEVGLGSYTAQFKYGSDNFGAKASSGTIAPVSSSTTISTVGSASVQGVSKSGAAGTIKVLAGTLSVDVVATVLNADGSAIGSGRNVVVSALTANGTTKLNGRTSANQILTTDANGQVTLTATSTSGASTESLIATVRPEGQSGAEASFTLNWEAQAYKLVDLNSTNGSAIINSDRTILKGGSYTLKLGVLDQWYQSPASADYRLKVEGGAVTDGFVTLTGGQADVTIADTGVLTSYSTNIDLQKASSGVFADVGSAVVYTTNVKKAKIVTAADGSSLYGATADLSELVAKKALLEYDLRLANAVKPTYGNDGAKVTGQIIDASTNVALEGAEVVITGPSNILFENGEVAKRGSITVLSDGSGNFAVDLFSTTAQSKSELTITSMGVSTTVDVTFTGLTAGEGSVLTIVAPNNVQPSSSFQVTVNLADALGNGVSTGTDGTIKIVRTGPGIAFGALPVDTDANGNASFSILLGANDTGSVTITASYDQNDDGDFVDAKDRVVTKTITVGASADTKVNAGSFKGFVAVYAKGYEGKRLSAKIGNDWVIVDPIVNNQENGTLFRVTDFTGAGVNISVRIYIDRVLTATIPLVTK